MPYSRRGAQARRVPTPTGQAADSPIPNTKREAASPAQPVASPVEAVATDQIATAAGPTKR